MKFYSPKTTEELIVLKNQYAQKAVVVGGCTDIIVKKGFLKDKEAIIETNSIEALKQIDDTEDKILIGSAVTFSQIKTSPIIELYAKALKEAACVCGSVQIRNRATIAGNIVNASPAADSVPALITSDTTLTIKSFKEEKKVKLSEFVTGPGKTILQPNEIITLIELNKDQEDDISFYKKIGTRKALSIAKASVAFKANTENKRLKNVMIAYGSVGPTVITSIEACKTLENNILTKEIIQKAALKASEEISPIDDIRSKAEYRKLVVKNILISELEKFI